MIVFESSYQHFIKINPRKKLEFANNLTSKDIISIVNDWKNFYKIKKNKTNESYEFNYNEFISILNNKNLIENSKTSLNKELKRVINSDTIANCLISEKNHETEEEII